MTPLDPNNFLESLIRFVAAAMTPALSLAPPRELWRGRAVEAIIAGVAQCAPLYTVARLGPGPGQKWEALPKRSIQWETVGPENGGDAAALRAQRVFETLLNNEGRPLQMKTIDGFKTDGSADGTWQLKNIVFLQTPTLIRLDENNRPTWVFNTDVDFAKMT